MVQSKIERRSAIEVCRLSKVKVGDVVNSSIWTSPRILLEVDRAGALVAMVQEDGKILSDIYVAKLPMDLHAIEHPARKKRSDSPEAPVK